MDAFIVIMTHDNSDMWWCHEMNKWLQMKTDFFLFMNLDFLIEGRRRIKIVKTTEKKVLFR